MSNQRNDERQEGRGIRFITAAISGFFAGLTRAIADAVLHHLANGR